MNEKKIQEIRDRLDGVKRRGNWNFVTDHEMFVGHTNAIEEGNIPGYMLFDLGRHYREYEPYIDGGVQKMRLSAESVRRRGLIDTLGQFLASCREDIDYLLKLVEVQADRETHDGSD